MRITKDENLTNVVVTPVNSEDVESVEYYDSEKHQVKNVYPPSVHKRFEPMGEFYAKFNKKYENFDASEYHHSEEFDADRTYEMGPYTHDFGHGETKYVNCVVLCCDSLPIKSDTVPDGSNVVRIPEMKTLNEKAYVVTMPFTTEFRFQELGSEFRSTAYASYVPNAKVGGYHHVEEFDENKIYSAKPYSSNFGYGRRMYKDSLWKVTIHTPEAIEAHKNDKFWESTDEDIESVSYYVVSSEEFDEKELKDLEPYCRCEYHRRWAINPIKYIICPCCVGCISAGTSYARQSTVDKARAYKKYRESIRAHFWNGQFKESLKDFADYYLSN